MVNSDINRFSEIKKIILDSNNNNLLNGDAVKLVKISGALIDGLPESDVTAIENQINKIMVIQSFSEHGHVELEFTDADGNMHSIWVNPKDIQKE